MNPHLLTLALTTPLEQLLELPNAVRIAASAREDLQRFNPEQLQGMLACIDAMITDIVAQDQSTYGSGLVKREEQRDLDWFIEASNRGLRSTPTSVPKATERDCFRVLALYKLGEVIHATADTTPVALINPVVATLMEALESLLLADLLPDSPFTEQIIEDAWRAGLTPEADAADEVRKAQSRAGRNAANVRHASNRAAKKKALGLYAANTYRTQDEAYRIIGAQVCRAPGTVKNWILAAKKTGTSAE
ncbi:MAG: hypothetical protein IDH49_14395 [Gammaproteobacteria bacterium]|nr:hypothetical protein [Gammaproteobacteria bacterium]